MGIVPLGWVRTVAAARGERFVFHGEATGGRRKRRARKARGARHVASSRVSLLSKIMVQKRRLAAESACRGS